MIEGGGDDIEEEWELIIDDDWCAAPVESKDIFSSDINQKKKMEVEWDEEWSKEKSWESSESEETEKLW